MHFADDDNDDDENTKSLQIMSYNICCIIIDFLEFNIPKALCIEHNSYYCYYGMNDKLFGHQHINRIKTIIGRLPMRNRSFRFLSPFVYIGNDAITYCGKYNNRNKQKGMKQNTKYKRKYESMITFPIKYNLPIFTNNLNKNINVESDFKELWKYIMNVDVGINNINHPILILMPSQTPFLIKQALMKFAFKTMHVPALCVMDKNALILSLFNAIHDDDNDNGNGIIIEISNDITSITPIIDYKIYQHQMKLSTFHSGICYISLF